MVFQEWILFVVFWAVFVTSPGPNGLNCIQNGMTLGFRPSLWGVLAILTQSVLFQLLTALGIFALIAVHPAAFNVAKLAGAGFLIFLGMRAWIRAGHPVRVGQYSAKSVYLRAFAIATINPKSVAGYLAVFSQFIKPDQPLAPQLAVIMPTALALTTMSYLCYTMLGAVIGRAALGAVLNIWFRRAIAAVFVAFGLILGNASIPERTLNV